MFENFFVLLNIFIIRKMNYKYFHGFVVKINTLFHATECHLSPTTLWFGKKRPFDWTRKKRLFEDIEDIINSIYKYLSYKTEFILRNYFLYFTALRETNNYHFHFVLKHEYLWNNKLWSWSHWHLLFLPSYFLSLFSYVFDW